MADSFDETLVFDTIKKMIGFTKDYTAFDLDLLAEINMVFGILSQLGVNDPITITNETTWASLNYSAEVLGMVKSYITAKVRLAFDPPQSGILTQTLKDRIAELEWRLNVAVDPRNTEGE